MALVFDFMAWNMSLGFVLATELHEPDAVLSIGIMRNDYAALLALINREPMGLPTVTFSNPKRV